MKRLLLSLALSLVFVALGQYIAWSILKWDYSGWSFNAGMITIILLYVVCEIIYDIKDRTKGVAKADITITVKEGSSSEDIEDAFVTGLKTFNAFKKLGKTTKERIINNETSEDDEELEDDKPGGYATDA